MQTEQEPGSGAVVRPFGRAAADLDVDFSAPRPIVVTQLLAACTHLDAETWWQAPIHRRIVELVGLAEHAGPPIELVIDCACGSRAAVEITAAELVAFEAERTGSRAGVEVDGVMLRIPTGRDQLAWLGVTSDDDSELAVAVLSRLVEGDGAVSRDNLVEVERALADADPIVDFRIDTTCPSCASPLAAIVDLESIALHRLRRSQRTLLDEIDMLARTYHWSERDILALPAWRRAEYLSVIERRR
jgi:hypothetical protein